MFYIDMGGEGKSVDIQQTPKYNHYGMPIGQMAEN
jgi:hypothetical protein